MPSTTPDFAPIKQLFSYLGLSAEDLDITVTEDLITVKILVSDTEAGRYIGRFASTLDSLQLLISLMVNQGESAHFHVLVDAGGYRERRLETLHELAGRAAAQVESTGMPHSLPPLSATERRQIHLYFKDHATLTTYSAGEGAARRLIVAPKNS